MSVENVIRPSLALAIIAGGLACISSSAIGVEARRAAEENIQQVDLFDAMEAGQIEVKFIPRDATVANVLVENKTREPLHIRLPEAFAAVPIQAQFGGGGFGGGGLGGGGGGLGGGGGGGGQGLGGGFGGGGGGLGGGGGGGGFGGGGGGFMRIAPEKRQKVAVATVCLEHGKPDPTPKMAYKMIPIEMFTQDPRVIELCRYLAVGKVPQNTAQAAAWHLANGKSWQELAKINRSESKYTGSVPFFQPRELQTAMAVVGQISKTIADAPAIESATASRGEAE